MEIKTNYGTAKEALVHFRQAATTRGFKDTEQYYNAYRKAALDDLVSGNYDKAVQGEVNIIQMRSLYEGVARRVLIEDLRPTGSTKMYSVVAQQGGINPLPAMEIQSTVGSSPQFVCAGDMVYPELQRLSVSTQIPLKTIATMPENVVPVWQEQAVRGITMQEDMMLWQNLDMAITEYATVTGDASHTITAADGTLSWAVVNQAFYEMQSAALSPTYLVVNPNALQYIMQWDSWTSSVLLKNELTSEPLGQTFQLPMGLTVITSITVPKGVAYMLPDPLQLGYLPTIWGLTATEDPKALSNYMYTVDYNELIGVTIINPRAPYKIDMSGSNTVAAVKKN